MRRFVAEGEEFKVVGRGKKDALLQRKHSVTMLKRAILFRGQATWTVAVCNIIPRTLFCACLCVVSKVSQL